MAFSNSMQIQQTDAVRYDSSEDILLVIDFQNVYLPGNPWACPTVEQAIKNTLNIIHAPGCPEYVITRYIAPADPVGRWKQYNDEFAQINADDYLCDFTEPIKKIVNDENVIVKDTYSALKSDALRSGLEGKKRIILTGVVAECCILASMMDAIDLGYEVVYLYDCISGLTAENETMIRTLAESFSPIHTRVMNSAEYLQLIQNNRL